MRMAFARHLRVEYLFVELQEVLCIKGVVESESPGVRLAMLRDVDLLHRAPQLARWCHQELVGMSLHILHINFFFTSTFRKAQRFYKQKY